MRSCLGLIILLFVFGVCARSGVETKTSTLLLRGRVPASTTIEWNKDENIPPTVRFNDSNIKPRVDVHHEKDHRKITITHP